MSQRHTKGPSPSSRQRRSRKSSVDTTASSEVSTRSTVYSTRWEAQSGGGGSWRGEDETDDDDDAHSQFSRYSYVSSQRNRRTGYPEEASFLSQAMLGVSRQSYAAGGTEDSLRSRRSARASTAAASVRSGTRLLTGRSGGGGGGSEAGSELVSSTPSRLGLHAANAANTGGVAGANRSHVSMDGYAREEDPPTRSRRQPGITAASALTGPLTSMRLEAVQGAAAAAASGGRRVSAYAAARQAGGGPPTLHADMRFDPMTGGMATETWEGVRGRAGGHTRDALLASLNNPLGEQTSSVVSSSSGATLHNTAEDSPGDRRGLRHANGSTHRGGESTSSGTHRSSDRIRLSNAVYGRHHPFSVSGTQQPSARAAQGRSTTRRGGGILSYAHSRLARRPVLVWRQPFRVTAMATTRSGRLYTGGDPNGAIVAWDSRTGVAEYILEGHQASVLALELLPTQDLLLSASADRTARLWSLQTLQTLYTFEGHGGLVGCVACAWVEELESMAFFTGSDDAMVRQWSVERGGGTGTRVEGGVATCLHVFKGHRQPINALCCLEDATHVLSGDGEGILRAWSMQAQKCVTTLEAHEGEVMAIQQLNLLNTAAAVGEDGIAVCFATAGNGRGGARGGCVRVWQASWMHTTVLLAELSVADMMPSVRCLFSYHHFLFVGGAHGELMMWDSHSGEVTALCVFHTQAVRGLTLHNNQLCSCSFDHNIARWDVAELLGVEQQPTVPYQPYANSALNHAAVFMGGSGGAAPPTLALLRGSRASRRAQALVASRGDGSSVGEATKMGAEAGPLSANGVAAGVGGDGGTAGGGGGGGPGATARTRLAAAAAYELKDISVAEAADVYTELPLQFVLDRLGASRFNAHFYLNVILSAAFCVVFCVLFGLLYPVAEGFYVMAGLEAQLGNFPLPSVRSPRTFFSINSVHWFFRWLDITVQHLWRDRAQTDIYPAIGGNNILLSTLRLRVKRVSCESCEWNPAVLSQLPSAANTAAAAAAAVKDLSGVEELEESRRCRSMETRCYADWNKPHVRESTAPYLCPVSATCGQYRELMNISELAAAADVDPHIGFVYDKEATSRAFSSMFSHFDQGGFYVDLFYTDDFTAQRDKIAALESLGFVDDVSTRLADTVVYTYNPNMDIFTLSAFRCEVPSAGAWLCSVNSKVFEVFNAKTMQPRLACHIVLFLLALALAAMCVFKCVKAAQERRLLRRLLGLFVWVDLVEVALTIVITGFFFRWMHLSASISVRELVEVTAADRRADLIAKNTQHRAQLTQVAELYRAYLRLAGIAAIGMSVRVILSLSSISYLRFFADVFRHARPLLVAFAVIHTILLLGFAQAAHLLYGRTMLDYSHLGRSFMTLMHRQWGAGDSTNSIESALTERWVSSVFFFLCFFVVFILIALSLLVAILTHSYTKTSKLTVAVPLSQTLWKRGHDVRYRLRWEALRRSWLCQRVRRLARRCRRWVKRQWRSAQERGRAVSSVGFGATGTGSAAHSIVLGASSHAAAVSTTSSTRAAEDVASVGGGGGGETDADSTDEDLVEGADALAEHRLLKLLKEKLEDIGLGDAAEDGGGGGNRHANGGAGRGLSASAELGSRWGWGRTGSGDPGSSMTTLSTISSSANSPSHGGVMGSRGQVPAPSLDRRGGHGGGRVWHGTEPNAELSHASGSSQLGGNSSGREESNFSRWFAVDRRSFASGTVAQSQFGAKSSVLVEQMRAKEQNRVHRLATVMVRKTDIAFLLAAVVEEATEGVARASETMDTFMDAYSRSFVNHLWEDLAWHYHYVHRSETRRARAAKEVQLRDRVESALVVLAPSFALVDSAQRQLEAQEGHLWPLVQALEQHGDTMRHAGTARGDLGANNDESVSGGAASTVSGQSTRAMYSYSRQF